MKLKDFRRLNVLNFDICRLEKQIEQSETKAEKCTVSYTEASGGAATLNRKEDELVDCVYLIHRLKQAQAELDKINKAYNCIDDKLVACALNLKYDIEHLGAHPISWAAAARSLGGGTTGDSLRMLCKRYVEKL